MNKKEIDFTMKGRLTVKGIKTFRGMEGHGLNTTLYLDNKKVCFVIDDANGGCFNYQVSDKVKFAEIEKYIKTLPEVALSATFTTKVDMDILVDELVNISLAAKDHEKMIKKTATAIVVKTATGYAYTDFKIPLAQVKDLQKYLSKIRAGLKAGEVILNKEFA